MKERFKLAVMYGGNSGEHEVSLRSAYWVLHYLDRDRFDPVAIGIDKSGQCWLTEDVESIIDEDAKSLSVKSDASRAIAIPSKQDGLGIDVIFPAIHGPLYEDGHLQGALTLGEVPFVGPEMTTCAIAMDKVLSKQLAQVNGVPVVPWDLFHRSEFEQDEQGALLEKAAQHLGFPMVVKPANLGSSVGISFVDTIPELKEAMKLAFSFDKKVLVEQVVSGHELEVGVLENTNDPLAPRVSLPGEIIVNENHRFYSYEAKYLDPEGAAEVIPADVPEALQQQCQSYAKAIFTAFDGCGMARIDFLYDKASETLYFNEFNPIPGFTPISLYPKLWQNEGIDFTSLVSELVDAALVNAERRSQLKRDYN